MFAQKEFQYHTGSIQTVVTGEVEAELTANFNTTLVLFKRFSTNWALKGCFYFNTTLVLFKQKKTTYPSVFPRDFNTTLVLFKPSTCSTTFTSFFISIPHWFYSNLCWLFSEIHWTVFQYHTGSIQTDAYILFLISSAEFQYHTGSIQTKNNTKYLHFSFRFQYHTGSIQTVICMLLMLLKTHFNTTLVLFKQYKSKLQKYVYFNFNTTLVLFKHDSKSKSIQGKRISIPHWFYSNW